MISQLTGMIARPIRRVVRAIIRFDSAYVRGHPELAWFPTDADRRAAMRTAARRTTFSWRFAAGLLVGVITSATLARLGIILLGRFGMNLSRELMLLAVSAPLFVGGVIATNWWLRRGVPDSLRRSLLDCGVPICRPCGYPLRGVPLSSARCPECGRPFDERVRALIAPADHTASACTRP